MLVDLKAMLSPDAEECLLTLADSQDSGGSAPFVPHGLKN